MRLEASLHESYFQKEENQPKELTSCITDIFCVHIIIIMYSHMMLESNNIFALN